MRANETASENILVDVSASLIEQEKHIDSQLRSLLAGEHKLDGIFNVAGNATIQLL